MSPFSFLDQNYNNATALVITFPVNNYYNDTGEAPEGPGLGKRVSCSQGRKPAALLTGRWTLAESIDMTFN